MSGVEIAAIISAAGNILIGLWGLRKKQDLEAVSRGMVIVEDAVEESKLAIGKSCSGKRASRIIETYGPAATEAVDVARTIANDVARDRYVRDTIAREELERAMRDRDLER